MKTPTIKTLAPLALAALLAAHALAPAPALAFRDTQRVNAWPPPRIGLPQWHILDRVVWCKVL